MCKYKLHKTMYKGRIGKSYAGIVLIDDNYSNA